LPVFWLTWSGLGDALRDGGRGAGESVRDGRIRRALVASEIALTLTVLCGAALLVKSLIKLQEVDPGFRPQGMLSFRLSLPDDPYEDNARLHTFLDTLEGRLRGLPGVSSVAFVTSLPPDRLQWANNYVIEGDEANPGVAAEIIATSEYFQTTGIPLKRGRGFTAADGFTAPPVAVVSDAFARQHFPDGRAVGRRFRRGGLESGDPWTTIVGVVGDVPYEAGVWGGTRSTIYLPDAQKPGNQSPYVVLRTANNPAQLVPAARQAVLQTDGQVPLRDVATMEERMHASMAAPRFRSLLFSLLAAIALIVAVTGIYGILGYHVNQRRRETAIRRALGAPATRVAGTVVGAGLRLTLGGIVVGLAGGFALARTLSGVLYGVQPNDPAVFAAAAGILAIAALGACAVPAIRAVRIDPVSILREE
jgi:putative ABC transport system permease protein